MKSLGAGLLVGATLFVHAVWADGSATTLVVKERTGRVVHVFVDGVDKGAAPWEGDVAPGTHDVSVVAPDLASPVQHVATTTGERTVVEIDAAPATARVEIQTRDHEGQIALDGRVVGEGSFKSDVPVGTHKVTVSRVGFSPHEESITLAFQQVFVETIVLDRVAGAAFVPERPLKGSYGGFGATMIFEPGGSGDAVDTGCTALSAASCSTPVPIGGALSGYAGYTWNPVGLEIFLAAAFDQAKAQAHFDGQGPPTENPFNTNPPRTEAFTFYRFGGVVAVRARATVQTSMVRASVAAGAGLAYKYMQMLRKTNATDGETDSYSPKGTSYVSPAIVIDGTVGFRVSKTTVLAAGMQLFVENAGGGTVAPGDLGRRLSGGTPLPTPSYPMASSVQVLLGPYIGLQFGP